jgi:hypothetical protein
VSTLKKQSFWFVIGAILLVEAAFLYFGVLARGAEIRALQEDLDEKALFMRSLLGRDEVPSGRLKEQYQKIKDSHGKHEQLVMDYYLSRDQSFEPENLGPLAEYRATYHDAMDHLEREFKEGTGAPVLEGGKRRFRIEQGFEEADMVLVEKRYRIQKELADILIQAGVKDLVEVKFATEKKEKKKPRRKGRGAGQEPLIEYDTHDLSAEIICPFGAIPKILASIHKSSSIPFRLRRMVVRKRTVMGEQPMEDESMQFVAGNSLEKTFEAEEKEAHDTLTDDQIFPEPPVELVLMLEVIDIREMAKTSEDKE